MTLSGFVVRIPPMSKIDLFSSLYLTEDREIHEHEEVELLLEGYRWDLQVVHSISLVLIESIVFLLC